MRTRCLATNRVLQLGHVCVASNDTAQESQMLTCPHGNRRVFLILTLQRVQKRERGWGGSTGSTSESSLTMTSLLFKRSSTSFVFSLDCASTGMFKSTSLWSPASLPISLEKIKIELNIITITLKLCNETNRK
jgi:hypothetical protein